MQGVVMLHSPSRRFGVPPRLQKVRACSTMTRECWSVVSGTSDEYLQWMFRAVFSSFSQGKTKGQQLKGKIVSDFFTLFSHFFTLFQNFPPRTFPSKAKGFSSMRTKEKKR